MYLQEDRKDVKSQRIQIGHFGSGVWWEVSCFVLRIGFGAGGGLWLFQAWVVCFS